jgi:integrase
MKTQILAVEAAAPKTEPKPKRERGSGGLYRRGKVWYFSYYSDGEQRIESSRSTKRRDASDMLADRLSGLRRGEVADVRKLKYENIRALAVAHYRAKGTLRSKTLPDGTEKVRAGTQNFCELDAFFGGMPVYKIGTGRMREFAAHRMQQGISGPTVNRDLALLRKMLNLAVAERMIQSAPKVPMQKENEPRQGFVERPQFEQIRATMPEHLRPYLTFSYETGCRPGATKKIVWPWVDLERREVRLPAYVVKTRKPLTIPLSAEVVSMLSKLTKSDGLVFDTKNLRNEWEKTCSTLGLGERTPVRVKGKRVRYQYRGLLLYDFRRSAARNLIAAGVPQATAKAITGHKTDSMFSRYNIVSVEQVHDAMQRLTVAAAVQMKIFSVRDNDSSSTVSSSQPST